jgi:type I restriction enzyme R subunit
MRHDARNTRSVFGSGEPVSATAAAALRIDDIIREHKIVNWTKNSDVQNQMQTAVEDYLHELEGAGVDLSFDEIDLVLEKCLDIARRRYAQ